jgi:hypothetical protein
MTLLLRVIFWVLLISMVNMTAWVLADKEPSCRWLGWVWYVTVQSIMFVAMVVGWLFLWIPCVLHAWKRAAAVSIKDGRAIDLWSWFPLNYVYGNPEDGVSGAQALIGDATGQLVPYLPNATAWRRAYLWSGWRNSCDNLKYVFQWANGPSTTVLGKKIGWWDYYGRRLPVL